MIQGLFETRIHVAALEKSAEFYENAIGHSLELIAPLNDPPKPDAGVVSLTEWEAMHGRTR